MTTAGVRWAGESTERYLSAQPVGRVMEWCYLFPPVPAYYIPAASVDELVDQSVGRMLDLFGLDTAEFARWKGW